ncbi:asparagine synthetase B [Candidatus Chloroploca sp. Khr17]|uniref:asparagine synthetase B family protein n=1 Tax=Candidatus Chloroploca sp. Khr17 TaxID=2496869 RepID=UPI00101BD968|nr:asparagine synthase-related protein [Candidatus Chloroploca sp. Khr17]
MSGVFGYFGSTASAVTVARTMGVALSHQRRSVVTLGAAGAEGALGHVGIGIFNRRAQPVTNADGCVHLCLCGEFYYQDRRRAELHAAGALAVDADDATLALAMYLREGATGLARLNGAFTVAVWDESVGALIIVNDRFGLYPHYYAHPAGALIFAPEIKGVLAAPGVPRRLDYTAVAEYVRFQQLLGERTWLEGVHLLPPAAILRYTPADGKVVLTKYWDFDAIKPAPRVSFDEAVEETIGRFQRAIDVMTLPPARVGVYLSGGLDGRTILGFIHPDRPVQTLTFGAASSRDVHYGTALAQCAGRPHRWFSLDDGRWVLEEADRHLMLTEGMHSWMHAHGMSTLEEASALIDVHLSGWDGGTTMGGRIGEYADDYLFREATSEATLAARMYEGFCRAFTWPGLTDEEASALFLDGNLAGRARESLTAELARTAHYAPPYRADYFYILQHCRRSTQNMIVFQRSAFEVRCPFFDYDLINWLYSLPMSILASPVLHRAVITRRMPALAHIPCEKDNLPPHSSPLVRGRHRAMHRTQRVVNRLAGPYFPERPRLYADYENYLRHELKPWAEAILLAPRTLERGLFDPAMVRLLWERHQRGDELWTIGKIAPLITLELVMRRFIDAADQSTWHDENKTREWVS